jgi:hypothetical protein
MNLARIVRKSDGLLGCTLSALLVIASKAMAHSPEGAPATPLALAPAQDRAIRERLMVKDYSLQRLSVSLPHTVVDHLSIPIVLDNQQFRLDLKRHSLRSERFQAKARGRGGTVTPLRIEPAKTFRGQIAGIAGIGVAASLARGQLRAQIIKGDATWWIEPLSRTIPNADRNLYVTYRNSDLVPGNWRCGVPDGVAANATSNSAPYGPSVPGCLQQAEIAFDSDYEFFQLLADTLPQSPPPTTEDISQAVVDDIEGILNNVDFIYRRDVRIAYQLITIIVQTAEPDPYSATNPGALLNQFRDHWLKNHGDVQRDVAHLMTGKEIDGNVIGIAWLAGVCNTFGFGLSESRFSGNYAWRVRVTAHELGHNWAAPHCNGDPECSIMCASVSGCDQLNMRFEPGTANIILAYRNAVTCLDDAAPPAWSMQKAIPASALEGDRAGVAMAMDGNLAIIGAYQTDRGVTDSGAAYIYRYDAKVAQWVEEQKIIPSDPQTAARFGVSVGILNAPSGDLAVVGAYLANVTGQFSGAAYVFRKSPQGGWVQEQRLFATDRLGNDRFGRSVAIAHEGGASGSDIILVGAPQNDGGTNGKGAAYIFRKSSSSSVWVQEAKLTANDAQPGDQLGISVSLAVGPNGGEYALAGAWKGDGNVPDSGAAYVFRKTNDRWVQSAKLFADDGATNDQFGISVSLDINELARVALIGSFLDDSHGADAGAAYVFRDNISQPGGFTQEFKLVAPDASVDDHFGNAVSIKSNMALIGAFLEEGDVTNAGAAYLFRYDEVGWQYETKFRAPDADEQVNDFFGYSVAMGSDGLRAMIGCWQDDERGLDAGAFYILTNGVPITDCNGNGVSDACDIASGASQDSNANGIPDECEFPPCAGDISPPPNGNGVVNIDDLFAVINQWGACPQPCPPHSSTCSADVAPPGGNCVVNIDDLFAVITAWGQCP